jgi:hypothetical protein
VLGIDVAALAINGASAVDPTTMPPSAEPAIAATTRSRLGWNAEFIWVPPEAFFVS